MRTKEAIINTIVSLISYALIIIVGFVSQRIFKDTLGTDYLGIHGLFTNIMTMLAVVELGFGTAIVSNMYKPVANNDKIAIISLLQFYKKVYHILAFVILGIGLCLLPFINLIVGETEIRVNFRIIFLFYLADTVSSYFLTYKRSILYANQKTYYTNIIHIICVILMNIMQILFLLKTHNYYIYLFLRIFFRLLENIGINIVANKKYSYITISEKYSLDKSIRANIIQKIKGLLFHRVGTFIVLGSDNIIISTLPNLGIRYIALYNNYLMIINQLNSLINQMFNSLTASVGNLLVEDNNDKTYVTFKKLQFFNGWLYIYVSLAFYFISYPFVEIWMGGKEFVFSTGIVVVLTVNFFLQGMRHVYSTFKDAAGIFYEDRFVPLIESGVNIVVSLILGYYLGLVGVFIGTICSNLVLLCYSYPKFVYKKLFDRSAFQYFGDLIKWIILFIVCFFITALVIKVFHSSSVYLNLLSSVIITLVVPNVIVLLTNLRTSELQYYFGLLNRIMKRGSKPLS